VHALETIKFLLGL